MGTPDFAVPCLERLLRDGHEVLAVFSQPDKPQGRKMALTPPPVKQTALAHGIPVWQPEKLRGNEEVMSLLRGLAPELIVVVAYGRILPQELLELPKYGCINVHASLLPKYRGAAPIQWSILNGERETGVTTMQMDAGIDTGGMLLQEKMPISEDMTSGELFERLSGMGAETLSSTITLLEQGRLTPQTQDEAQACYAPVLTKAHSPMDWSRTARELHNQVRGLNPWPGAFTEYASKRLKIHKSQVAEEPEGFSMPCGDGKYLVLLEVQPEGKKRMPGADFLRGLQH